MENLFVEDIILKLLQNFLKQNPDLNFSDKIDSGLESLHKNCSDVDQGNYTTCAVVLLFMEMLPIFNELI